MSGPDTRLLKAAYMAKCQPHARAVPPCHAPSLPPSLHLWVAVEFIIRWHGRQNDVVLAILAHGCALEA